MKLIFKHLVGFFFVSGSISILHAQEGALRLWYDQPAGRWEETLPLGNGRPGMMPDSKISDETIVLNDITLWSGGPQDAKAHEPASRVYKVVYGRHNELAYDLENGTFSLSADGTTRFSDVEASVQLGDRILHSTEYTSRRVVRETLSDGFGKGEKITVIGTASGMPVMRQVFYAYSGRSYVLMEVSLEGKALVSNSMSPFSGRMAVRGHARTLFVPFDNDTFISYLSNPLSPDSTNTSAEVGVVYSNSTRSGLIVGSVEHSVWKAGVATKAIGDTAGNIRVWGGYTEKAVNRDDIPHGAIKGNVIKSPLVFAGCYPDWRTGMKDFAEANRLKEPQYIFKWNKPTPVGWNSWGVMQDHLTYNKAIRVVDFFADSLRTFRSGGTAFIDLDAFWDYMVKGGTQGDFTVIRQFADYCKSKGLQPGVYFAPFADFGYKQGGDRLVEGSAYRYKDLWTKVGNGYHDIDGGRSIDPTHPGTRQHIAYMIRKLRDCGFTMIKIDFLGHAAAESTGFYDTTVTTGMQAFRMGMEYLDDQLGGQMLVYAAISPSMATSRYVHSRRIACDAFKTIEHTKYTLNSVTYGWWLTWLYNYVDADHVVLDHQTEGENRARLLSSVITGTFITGDDFSVHGPWSDRARAWYQNPALLKVVRSGKAFEPVEGDIERGASNLFVRRNGNRLYLAIFNYDTEERSFPINLRRLGLSSAHSYQAIDVLNGGMTVVRDRQEIRIPGADAALYEVLLPQAK